MAEQPKSNILKALEGLPVTTNQPKSRILQAIEDGGSGGGGGSYDDSELRRRIEALENQKPQTFIAAYQSTTAQDIIAFLETNPHAAVLVQNGDDVYSAIFSKILAENKVVLRVIASLQSKFNIFEYTITNGSWRATTTPLYYDDTEIKALIAKNSVNIDRIADYVGVELGVEYLPLAENQAVKLTGVKAIDTGLNLDGNAEITAKGCVISSGNQAILVGAYNSTNARTVLKILSASLKVQSQWASNVEITELNGLNLLQPFIYTQNKDNTQITQGNITLNCVNGGFTGISSPKIYLFNQTEIGEFNHGCLLYATITHGGLIYEFKPMRKIKDGVDLGVVMLKNGKELDLKGGVLELVEFN